MAGDVQDVVDAADDPKVSVLVPARAVAGEVIAFEFAPGPSSVARLVAVNRAQHRWPRLADDEFSADVRADFLPASHRRSRDRLPKKGSVALPGLVGVAPGSGVIMIAPVSVCHQVSTIGQRPPPIFS